MIRKLHQIIPSRAAGFTIIEVMIVLAIASMILLIVFLAVPALQRNARNTGRKRDAAQLISAVEECLQDHGLQESSCESTPNIPISSNQFSVFTTFHYGAQPGNPDAPAPPAPDDPNWLFGLTCSAQVGGWFPVGPDGKFVQYPHAFVVTYFTEDADGFTSTRCLDGGF